MARAHARLRTVKALHTVVWAVLAGCVLAIPVLAWRGAFVAAGVAVGIVLVETAVLGLNGGRCPLTDVAARYTADRRANFDIYLPAWLARWNKAIFGSLFVLGTAYAAWRAWGG